MHTNRTQNGITTRAVLVGDEVLDVMVDHREADPSNENEISDRMVAQHEHQNYQGFYPANGRSSWDSFISMSAEDERRMLRREGEGD